MSKHIQFESNMTLTGANADIKLPSTPTEQKDFILHTFRGKGNQ